MIVLDTATVAAVLRADPLACAELIAEMPGDVRIPQPVLAEVEAALRRLPRSSRKRVLQRRLELLLKDVERLPWTDRVSQAFGELKAQLEKKGRPMEDFDVAAAAHAIAYEATLLTERAGPFARISGLQVESWGLGDRP